MKIEKDCVVYFNFKIEDDKGELLEQSESEPASYIHGIGEALPKIEEGLEGHEVGYKTTIHLDSTNAFGAYDEELVITVDKSEFDDHEVAVGDSFDAKEEGEEEDGLIWRVIEIENDEVVLDANHPYAGLNLVFHIEVVEVREATEHELEHGHVCDCDGECGDSCQCHAEEE